MSNSTLRCPHCQNDDKSLLEAIWQNIKEIHYNCSVCGKMFKVLKS